MPSRLQSAVWCAALAVVCVSGCAAQQVKLRAHPHSPLVERFKLTARGDSKISDRVVQLLRRYDLDKQQGTDPQAVLVKLTEIRSQEPSEEVTYALAELSFLRGVKSELLQPQEALEHYWNTCSYAYRYLFDNRLARNRNPYDPQFRGACDLYNGGLERCLRVAQAQGVFQPGKRLGIHTSGGDFALDIVPQGFRWRPEDFDTFEFVADYDMGGLKNHYATYGLGVPLIAVRKKQDTREGVERYYPQRLSFPVTAFLRFHNQPGEKACICQLELHDPLQATEVQVAGVQAPLESDLSTPLAYFLQNTCLSGQETFGFLQPDKAKEVAGLYMLQPFQEDKIPVLFVHGLWSSPMTWMEMFNDLRSMPEIRDRYQFWFYMYPTGQPFILSAAELRQDLASMRRVFDGQRQNPQLDQMVLVGHSMGGLVSRLQTVNSGDEFWNSIASKPFRDVKADAELRQKLEPVFFFEANPSIRRVVSIGTPHRGSSFSNDFTRYVGRKLVKLPQLAVEAPQQLLAQNPDVFKSAQYASTSTSIDSLSPSCPILPVLLQVQKPQTVHYHNVVGVIQSGYLKKAEGDGIVSYASAHLDDVESEIVVDAPHVTVHQHPRAVLEVRRILLEHLRSTPQQAPLREILTTGGTDGEAAVSDGRP